VEHRNFEQAVRVSRFVQDGFSPFLTLNQKDFGVSEQPTNPANPKGVFMPQSFEPRTL
jgi:hypothetical protein